MATIDNPILNSPFAEPTRHWELDDTGIPVGSWAKGRRRSEYVVPAPPPRHQHIAQGTLELDAEYGKPKSNDYVNELRAKVGAWRNLPRAQQERSVTPVTAQLLRYWRNPERERRLFFCQIEAMETAIWLAEVAPRSEHERLRAWNADANPDLFRIALKLATGAGKTTVMAMLIAWQTLNRARMPGSSRFTDAFLVISPGITIRDRLRVLMPSDPNNTYTLHDLVPQDQRDALQHARVVITNYHAFQRHETMEAPKLVKTMHGYGQIADALICFVGWGRRKARITRITRIKARITRKERYGASCGLGQLSCAKRTTIPLLPFRVIRALTRLRGFVPLWSHFRLGGGR